MTYTIKLRGKVHKVNSIQAASDLFNSKQEILGRIIRSADIIGSDGEVAARISQNGNVWPAAEWFPGMRPIINVTGIRID